MIARVQWNDRYVRQELNVRCNYFNWPACGSKVEEEEENINNNNII